MSERMRLLGGRGDEQRVGDGATGLFGQSGRQGAERFFQRRQRHRFPASEADGAKSAVDFDVRRRSRVAAGQGQRQQGLLGRARSGPQRAMTSVNDHDRGSALAKTEFEGAHGRRLAQGKSRRSGLARVPSGRGSRDTTTSRRPRFEFHREVANEPLGSKRRVD